MRLHYLLPLLLGIGFSLTWAQTEFGFSGRIDSEFGVAWSGDLPVARAGLELSVSGQSGSGFFPDATFGATLLAGYDAASGEASLEPGSIHATLHLGDFDLSIGRQIVFWGSTDGINPVDVLNPRNLSFPPDARKIPVPLLRATWYAHDSFQLEAVLLPVFTPSVLPGEAWRPALKRGMLPPGSSISEQREPIQLLPEAEARNIQFGLRATTRFDGADVSLTYFHGFRSQPTLQPTLVPLAPGEFALQPRLHYSRIDLLGIDFSAAVSELILRGEFGWSMTSDADGADPLVENNYLQAVLGGEYAFSAGSNLVVQGILDWHAPDAGKTADSSFRLMTGLNHQLSTRTRQELAWLQDFDGSGTVVARVNHVFADGVTGHAGAWLFYGADGTQYGNWRDNSQVRIGMSYEF